ncbi:unannotated protein [freshwater metagenome]|uniref:Unannotated protein n=1 Tax=freshwater metagenome TaxID=449393 RepID=A0A6J6YJ11_9ZZZZ
MARRSRAAVVRQRLQMEPTQQRHQLGIPVRFPSCRRRHHMVERQRAVTVARASLARDARAHRRCWSAHRRTTSGNHCSARVGGLWRARILGRHAHHGRSDAGRRGHLVARGHSARHLGWPVAARRSGAAHNPRHSPSHASVLLPVAVGRCVWHRHSASGDGHRHLRHSARRAPHQFGHSRRRRHQHRSGHLVRVHRPPTAHQSSAAIGSTRHPAGHQPGDHDGLRSRRH